MTKKKKKSTKETATIILDKSNDDESIDEAMTMKTKEMKISKVQSPHHNFSKKQRREQVKNSQSHGNNREKPQFAFL